MKQARAERCVRQVRFEDAPGNIAELFPVMPHNRAVRSDSKENHDSV